MAASDTTTSTGTDWGSVLANLLLGGAGLAQAFGGGSTGAVGQAREAAGMADPFSGQRGRYQTQLGTALGGGLPNPYQDQLTGLLTNPSSFQTDPGYQFALSQGQEGISRAANALYGTQRSGAIAPELAKYTEGYANQAYDTRINQLTGLTGMQNTYNQNQIGQLLTASGATTGSPAAAGQMLLGGYQGQQAGMGAGAQGLLGSGALGALGSGLGGLINGFGSLFGGSASGSNTGIPGASPGSGTNTLGDLLGGLSTPDLTTLWNQNFGGYGNDLQGVDPFGFGGLFGLDSGGGGNDWFNLFGSGDWGFGGGY